MEERERPIPDQIVRKTEYVYPKSRERTGSGWSQALSKLELAAASSCQQLSSASHKFKCLLNLRSLDSDCDGCPSAQHLPLAGTVMADHSGTIGTPPLPVNADNSLNTCKHHSISLVATPAELSLPAAGIVLPKPKQTLEGGSSKDSEISLHDRFSHLSLLLTLVSALNNNKHPTLNLEDVLAETKLRLDKPHNGLSVVEAALQLLVRDTEILAGMSFGNPLRDSNGSVCPRPRCLVFHQDDDVEDLSYYREDNGSLKAVAFGNSNQGTAQGVPKPDLNRVTLLEAAESLWPKVKVTTVGSDHGVGGLELFNQQE
jgi:hypothetical protein